MNPSPAPLEAAWLQLRSGLEWADGLRLIFVFCSHTETKQELFRRADELMGGIGPAFERPVPESSGDLLELVLPIATGAGHRVADNGTVPHWFDLGRWPGVTEWDQARLDLLQALNVSRSLLEAEHRAPLVLVLPESWTKRAAECAPDLWTIRQSTVFVALGDLPSRRPQFDLMERLGLRPSANADLPRERWPASVKRWREAPTESLATVDLMDAASDALDVEAYGLAHELASLLVDKARYALELQSPKPAQFEMQLLTGMTISALSLLRLGKAEEAVDVLQKYLTFISLPPSVPGGMKYGDDLRAFALNFLGLGYAALSRFSDAIYSLQQCLDLRLKLQAELGMSSAFAVGTARCHEQLGLLWLETGELHKAHHAFELQRSVSAELPPREGARNMALAELGIANVWLALGDVEAAEVHLARAQIYDDPARPEITTSPTSAPS